MIAMMGANRRMTDMGQRFAVAVLGSNVRSTRNQPFPVIHWTGQVSPAQSQARLPELMVLRHPTLTSFEGKWGSNIQAQRLWAIAGVIAAKSRLSSRVRAPDFREQTPN